MLKLTRKFLDDNIKRCCDTLKFYDTKNQNSSVHNASEPEPELSRDALWAKAQLDAFVRIANFMNDDIEEVHARMNNEEACRTAVELFINESLKEPFDWFNAPSTISEASELIKKNCLDKEDLSKGFMAIIYFWYKFQRKK